MRPRNFNGSKHSRCGRDRDERLPGRPLRSDEQETLRSEEHTSELQSQSNLVCRLLLEKKKNSISETSISETTAPIPLLCAPSHDSRVRPSAPYPPHLPTLPPTPPPPLRSPTPPPTSPP